MVAEEVRNLAQRSAEAAKSTAALIEESQQNAENGVTVSTEVEGILEEISGRVEKVTQLIGELSAASEEQAQGIDQINTAVAQVDKVTQSNAANAEESASASEELSAQAKELNEMVNVLVRIVGGKTAGGNGRATQARATERRQTVAGGAEQAGALQSRVHRLLRRDEGAGKQAKPGASGGRKDEVLAATESKVVKPDEVIPLGDEELKEF